MFKLITLSFFAFLLRLVEGSDESLDEESSASLLLLLSDSESEVSATFPRFDFFFLVLGKRHETPSIRDQRFRDGNCLEI